jgi:serpin B
MSMSHGLVVARLTVCTLAATTVAPGCGGGSGAEPAAAVARSSEARITTPAVPSEDLAALGAGNDAFAVDLYRTLRSSGGNVVFAPESLSIALAMTFAGAAGNTAGQTAATMHYALPPERLHPAFDALDLALNAPPSAPAAFRLTVVNAVWAQQGFPVLPSFLDLLARNYGAGVRLADFIAAPEPARLLINQWVSAQTAGKIPELLMMGSINVMTRLVLTNAIYFKADWQTPFAAQSPMGTFHAPTSDVSVPMMTGPAEVPVWTGPDYTAARLPYAGGTTSMLLIVPDAGTFDAFEAALTTDTLQTVLAGVETAASQGVSLPRFVVDQHISVKTALMALGMTDAFDAPPADFSGIDGGHDLFIQDVIHQANVAVDEQGTEAAAATAVIIGRKGVVQTLRVDRPFLFLIRDDVAGATLFMGRVLDPSQ